MPLLAEMTEEEQQPDPGVSHPAKVYDVVTEKVVRGPVLITPMIVVWWA
jgi:hypothetical protein